MGADLNSTTFGGLRLPPTNNASPFGGYRAVTLDSIPIGLVGAITVTKSFGQVGGGKLSVSSAGAGSAPNPSAADRSRATASSMRV